MAQGIPEDVMTNHSLVKELAEVAKDTALLHGIQMRIHETPNSSEVRNENTGIFTRHYHRIHHYFTFIQYLGERE